MYTAQYNLPEIPKSLIDAFSELEKIIITQNKSKYSKLKDIYFFIDKFNSEFTAPIIKPSCAKGCSYCCYMDVNIMDIEARFIENNTGINIKNKSEHVSINNSTACHFLVDNTCSIYENRPFVCRTYHVLSPKEFCQHKMPAKMYGALPHFGNPLFQDAFVLLTQHLGNNWKDIHDWFATK